MWKGQKDKWDEERKEDKRCMRRYTHRDTLGIVLSGTYP